MSTSENELTGPDLTQGVRLSELTDGEMLVGHALGESVLLVRQGDEAFAVGAGCTHYGGPLAEGIVEGETVRCPWHHACFSLRTGEALHAPALRPVARWRVERRGDRLHVTEKLGEHSSHRAPADDVAPESIVIVGAGAAGDSAADTLRREGYKGRIMLLGADPSAPYDRPNLSKDYLAGTAPEEWIPLRDPDFYDEIGVTFVPGARVTAIDPSNKQVVVGGDETHSFDRLLLATGSEPARLPLPGSDLPHVFYLRSLAVHVVAPESLPMERIFGSDLARFVQKLHETNGVVFHLERTAASIAAGAVRLDNGEILEADLVLVGVGVRPDVSLAKEAGLDVDDGVVVDQYLETSASGIFAAGDIARWPDAYSDRKIRVEHWVVAQRQGQVAARNMLGRQEPFTAVPFFWSQHYDVPITYVGHAADWDRIDVAGSIDDRDCLVAYRRGGRTLAVAGIYRDRESLLAELALERQDEDALQSLVPSR